MNKTEKLAYKYLTETGVKYDEILHNQKAVYDFVTPSLCFEVKQIYTSPSGKKSIAVTGNQLQYDQSLNPTYLLFAEGKDTPVFIGKLKDIPSDISVYNQSMTEIKAATLTWEEAPKQFAAKISGNKITIPVELREIFGLKDGDTIVFEIKSIAHSEVKS